MKGPLLFLIVMTMLVLGAIRERRWAERQEKLRKAREAIAAFNAAYPAIREAFEAFIEALRQLPAVIEKTIKSWEEALEKIGPETYSNPDDEGLQS